ncbi:MAG: PorP/SprF family type IX secretion system membrane protein [Microscillaceae bacterium]|nr:PorP/SprF family type IX secretion system membrane protein [Microscillaceae bacterium]
MKQYYLLYFCFFSFLISISSASAQRSNFTQYDANSLYLNPAYTGATRNFRFLYSYRLQWAGADATQGSSNIDGRFDTHAISFDHFLGQGHGIGFQAVVDKISDSNKNLRWINTQLAASYAYEFLLHPRNDKKDLRLRLGGKVGFNDISLNADDLLFEDAIRRGITSEPINPIWDPKLAFDWTIGVLLSNRKFWLGGSLFNLIDQSSLFNSENPKITDQGYSVEGGTQFPFNNSRGKKGLKIGLRYKHETVPKQWDASVGYLQEFDKFGLLAGTYLRLNPGSEQTATVWNIAPYIGIKFRHNKIGKIVFQYSLDTSPNRSTRVGNIHEFSLRYEIHKKDNVEKEKLNNYREDTTKYRRRLKYTWNFNVDSLFYTHRHENSIMHIGLNDEREDKPYILSEKDKLDILKRCRDLIKTYYVDFNLFLDSIDHEPYLKNISEDLNNACFPEEGIYIYNDFKDNDSIPSEDYYRELVLRHKEKIKGKYYKIDIDITVENVDSSDINIIKQENEYVVFCKVERFPQRDSIPLNILSFEIRFPHENQKINFEDSKIKIYAIRKHEE